MFTLSGTPLDEGALDRDMDSPHAGAQVVFQGRVRDHNQGRRVVRLEYEAYGPLAEKEGARILEEARQRFDVVDARCAHRVGMLEIGEAAVWIAVTAAHRDAAFDACRFIIDRIKERVPIWKKEHYEDGESDWIR